MLKRSDPRAARVAGILHRLVKPFLWVLVGMVAFTLLGIFALPYLIRPVLEKRLSGAIHREVKIKSLSFNPYRLIVTARDVVIKDRSGTEPFITCDELHANYELVSIFKRAGVSSEFRLRRPYVRIVRFKDGSYNFSDLLEKKEPETLSTPIHFSASNIKVVNGSLDFIDEPEATTHEIRALMLSIPFISNIPYYVQSYVQPQFSATINGTQYEMHGRTLAFADTHETHFDINFTGLDLTHYLAYAPFKLGFKVPSGKLDAAIVLNFSESKGKGLAMNLAGTVALNQIALDDMESGPLFRLSHLGLTIAEAEPLLKTFHLSKITLQSPELYVSRSKAGTLNLQKIFPTQSPPAQQTTAAKKTNERTGSAEGSSNPLRLQVDDLQLSAGKIAFEDLSQSRPFKTVLQPIEVKLTQFDTAKDKKSQVHVSMRSEADEKIALDGTLSVEPLAAEGTLSLNGFLIRKYNPYYRDRLLFDIVDGRLDVATKYQYAAMGKGPMVNLSALALALNGLRLKKENEKNEFIVIPDLKTKDAEIDLAKREIKVGELSSEKGQIRVKRDKKSQVNLLNLLAPSPSQPAPPTTAVIKPAEASERAWLVSLKQVTLDRYLFEFNDAVPSQPVSLSAADIKLRAEDISTSKGSKGKASLSLLLNKKGSFSASGPIGIEPFFATLNLTMKNIDIAPFQPYFTDRVKIDVTGGDVSASGNVKLGLLTKSGEESNLQAAFAGETSMNRFASVDKLTTQDFLKWNSLALTGMNVTYNPTKVDIKGVALTDFYARVLINPDGTINLTQIFNPKDEKPEAAPAAQKTQAVSTPPAAQKSPAAGTPPAAQTATSPVKIDALTLQGGEIDFTDRSIKPNYSASLNEIGGRISGLSAEESSVADVELRGKLNKYAPLEITGKINPLKKDLFVDLKASFKDMDLGPASPYSGKYAGYEIEKGKLSLDVKYHIVNRKLDSENHVTIDQFNFGNQVNSPDATKLPVKLAVALLKDRNGVIKLDLPVSGSLDDPKFSIGRVILQIIMNLLTKAATSPFALLGAVFGHGEELSYIEFDYGSSAVPANGQQKIDTLVKALNDRPALKLDIEGFSDTEKDKDGLKQARFMDKLKTEKLNETAKKGEAPSSPDQVTIATNEYEKYLRMAYKNAKFPKPRSAIGFAKDLPVPEMEKLMLANTIVTDDDGRALASARASRVRDLILKSGNIGSERLFMLEPKSVPPGKQDKPKNSRVTFALH